MVGCFSPYQACLADPPPNSHIATLACSQPYDFHCQSDNDCPYNQGSKEDKTTTPPISAIAPSHLTCDTQKHTCTLPSCTSIAQCPPLMTCTGNAQTPGQCVAPLHNPPQWVDLYGCPNDTFNGFSCYSKYDTLGGPNTQNCDPTKDSWCVGFTGQCCGCPPWSDTNPQGEAYCQASNVNWQNFAPPSPAQSMQGYATLFKNACPTAYSFQFDDKTSTAACVTTGGYNIVFLSASSTPVQETSSVTQLTGKAQPVGAVTNKASMNLTGQFTLDGTIDLSRSTLTLGDLLNEVGGAGELLRGTGGANLFPLTLLPRRGGSANKATFETPSGVQPRVQVKVETRDPAMGLVEFRLRVDSATIPQAPLHCAGGPPPTTGLLTSFTLNDSFDPPVFTAQDLHSPVGAIPCDRPYTDSM